VWWKLGIGLLAILLLCFGCAALFALWFTNQNQVAVYNLPLQQKWAFEADDLIRSMSKVYDDQIFIRTKQTLYAINVMNGELIWSVSLPKDATPAPPVIQDDVVVITHIEGTRAFKATTGQQLWQASDQTKTYAFPAVIDENVVVVLDCDIRGRDIKTGELLWTIPNPFPCTHAYAIINNKKLYSIFKDRIDTYDLESGQLLQSIPTIEWLARTGIFDNGVFYLEQRAGGMAAYDLENRRILWHRDEVPLSKYPKSKAGNLLVLGLEGSFPIAVDASTGETIWLADQLKEDDSYQTPLVMGDIVYIRGLFQKKIYALKRDNGRLIGYIRLGVPDIISTNETFSLGPVHYKDTIIFPAGHRLLAYAE
jgi:outer membrane protein assembly factor BamB